MLLIISWVKIATVKENHKMLVDHCLMQILHLLYKFVELYLLSFPYKLRIVAINSE
jgi:hypothetical protein